MSPMTNPTPAAGASLTAEDNIGSVLDADVIYQLRKFRHDNHPTGQRGLASPTAPTREDPPASDREVYDLLVFAARTLGPRPDYTLPRTLEALRLVNLVPEDIGAAIFAKIEDHPA
jgi:hypothetical protein